MMPTLFVMDYKYLVVAPPPNNQEEIWKYMENKSVYYFPLQKSEDESMQ
jgi:hypothetical protein